MRKTILSILLLFICFSLYAQTYREANIYVPPITGAGSLSENTFFYRLLAYEVTLQYHSVVRNQTGSDYTLLGFIDTYIGFFSSKIEKQPMSDNMEPPVLIDIQGNENSFVFNLQLLDSKTGEIFGEQYIIYDEIDSSVNALVSAMIYNLFSCLPVQIEANDWRNNWLFLDASILWSPRLYISQHQSINWMNIGLGLSAEYHFLDFLSIGLGLNFTQDWLVIDYSGLQEFRDLIMEIPLSIKYVFKPADHFMLEPYLSFSANISMMQVTRVSPFSWSAGFQFGVKAGPGIVTIDPRFTMDIFPSELRNLLRYNRYIMQIGFGYKIGLLPKNVRDY